MYKRSLKPKLEKAFSRSRVILLNGARQVGKTTLMKEICLEKGYFYLTFDDMAILSAAKNDPKGFIAGLQKPIILDEIQRVPELFLAIKMDVDTHQDKGRYALTGSANPLLLPKLGDSLAGRMEIFDLYPLSQGELHNTTEVFIDNIFDYKFNPLSIKTKEFSKQELYKAILKGGYPEIQNYDEEDRSNWFKSYVSTILDRDVRDISNIEGLSQFPLLLKLLASRPGTLLNVADLSRSIKSSNPTIHRYLTLLQTIFFIRYQQPWHANLGKRLVKAPKTYFVDTGLLSYLLGINLEGAMANPYLMGGVLENFVVNELIKQASWSKARVSFYHFRTSDGVEVDIVMENAAGEIIGIEVKSSSTVTTQDFKGLSYLAEELGDKFIRGIVIYTGTTSYPHSEKICALPISALWSV